MNNFDDVQVFTGQQITENVLTPKVQGETSVAVEQTRAIAEVQAAMAIAHMYPRDENAAYIRITKACNRMSFAKKATYAYPRGGTTVSGPTIRLAEVLARYWGNLDYGFKEIYRNGNSSKVVAYCWDLETNTRATREFTVTHFRDVGGGTKKLEAERDKYEHIAAQAQRRVRACIIEIIPGDFVEAAEEECRRTIMRGDGRPIEDRIREMLKKFDEIGVSQDDIETLLQHYLPPKASIQPAELVRLQEIYRSLKDGMAMKSDFFKPTNGVKEPSEPQSEPEKPKKKQPKKTKEPEKEDNNPFAQELAFIREHGSKKDIEDAEKAISANDEETLGTIMQSLQQLL